MIHSNGGATKPFKTSNANYPFTLLYDDGHFLIASGDDSENEAGKERLNIGVRWHKGRAEAASHTPNSKSAGFPSNCWFMLPCDFAISVLTQAKNKTPSQSCQIDKDEIDKAIQTLKAQI